MLAAVLFIATVLFSSTLLSFFDSNYFVDTENKQFRIEPIVDFCQTKGIAFYDTATAVRRLKDNASDKFLEVEEATNIAALLRQLPHCLSHTKRAQQGKEQTCYIPSYWKQNLGNAFIKYEFRLVNLIKRNDLLKKQRLN